MNSLGSIFASAARTELLYALRYQHDDVGLRQLARLAGVHPHSAERVLADLVRERLVTMRKTPARTFYRKNLSHPDWRMIDAVCDGADRARRELLWPALNLRAKSLLPFIEEADAMLSRARRTLRVA